ncbi:MAG: DEAD/DEAH box helicase family protein, partial [Thermoproteota archaeon]
MNVTRLRFEGGTILIQGEVGTPYGRWDPRVEGYRVKAMHYQEVLRYLEESGVRFKDEVPDLPPRETLEGNVELRGYQQEGLEKWKKANRRGVIVLPTAAGKTYIGLKAISLLEVQTLIVVPTLDLLDQWKRRIEEYLNVQA